MNYFYVFLTDTDFQNFYLIGVVTAVVAGRAL
jgi:hypothetical protein